MVCVLNFRGLRLRLSPELSRGEVSVKVGEIIKIGLYNTRDVLNIQRNK